MAWLIIKHDRARERRENLVAAKLPVMPSEGDATEIAFPERYADRVLEVLGLMAVPGGLESTRHRNVTRMAVEAILDYSEPLVFVERMHEAVRALWTEIVAEFQTDLGCNIAVDGRAEPLTVPGVLGVHLFAVPPQYRESRLEVYRGERESRDRVRMQRVNGRRLREEARIVGNDGSIVAVYLAEGEARNLWITLEYGTLEVSGGCACGECRPSQERFVMPPWMKRETRFIMRSALSRMMPDKYPPQTYAEYQAGREREIYIDQLMSGFERHCRASEEAIERAAGVVAERLKQYIESYRAHQAMRLNAEGPDALASYRERLARDYDELRSSADVEQMSLTSEELKFRTRPVAIEYDGYRYAIGRFDITVDTRSGSMQFVAVDRSGRDSTAHPHIGGGGRPCLGNLSQGVAKLIADRQYSVLVHLLVRYLETYNPGDAYSGFNFRAFPRERIPQG